MEIFRKNFTLQDKILEYLREGEDSISGLHRKLEKEGIKLHRLVLTGYLKALSDVGILKESEVKPSKVYSLKPTRRRDLYEFVGEIVRDFADSKKEQARLCVYVLQKLFRRPIFLEEVKKCGLDVDDIEATKIGGEKRLQARKTLSNTYIKLPYNDPAYMVKDDEKMDRIYTEILRGIILQALNAKAFVFKGKQLKLE